MPKKSGNRNELSVSPVPAKIVRHLSSSGTVVPENGKVTLTCNVTGVPTPEVTWYRHTLHKKDFVKQSEFSVRKNRKKNDNYYSKLCNMLQNILLFECSM